jgi:hypothetical protein
VTRKVRLRQAIFMRKTAKKMGRPKLAKNQARRKFVSTRLSPPEYVEVATAATGSAVPKTEWLRDAVLLEAKRRPVWLKSKWTVEDLNGKLVEYKLISPLPDGRVIVRDGLGEFRVRENSRNEISVDIFGPIVEENGHWTQNRYWLAKGTADKIEFHPNQEKAQFRLIP